MVQIAVSVGFLSVVGVLAQVLFGFSYQRYQLPGSEILIAQVYMGAPDASHQTRADMSRREAYRRHYERSREQFD